MRALVISRVYADPTARGKLRALASLGVTVSAAVPDRWIPAGLVQQQQTAWGDDGGVRTVPVPIRGSALATADPFWHTGTVRGLLTDFRPEVVQIEEEPWSNGAASIARAARKLGIPYVVLTREPPNVGTLAALRRNRARRRRRPRRGERAASRLALMGRPSLPIAASRRSAHRSR